MEAKLSTICKSWWKQQCEPTWQLGWKSQNLCVDCIILVNNECAKPFSNNSSSYSYWNKPTPAFKFIMGITKIQSDHTM